MEVQEGCGWLCVMWALVLVFGVVVAVVATRPWGDGEEKE